MDDRILSRDVPLSAGGPDPEQSDRVMLSRHRVSRIYYLQKFLITRSPSSRRRSSTWALRGR